MAKYYAIYECQMCDSRFRISDKPTEIDENTIPEVMASVVKNQQLIGSGLYQAPMFLPHRCSNGDGGLAQLIGFRRLVNYTWLRRTL